MARHTSSNQNNRGHLVLSHNLLKLLQWIVDYESETLKQVVIRAVKQGFPQNYMPENETIELHIADETLQQTVSEFLGLIDTLLAESMQDQSETRFMQRNLIPVLDHIDSAICDEQMVQNSIERANSKLNAHPNTTLQELVLQELLKQWKPAKKETLN